MDNTPIARRMTEEQREELMELRLTKRLTLEQCVEHVETAFKLTTSISALANFFRTEESAWRLARSREIVKAAMELGGPEITEAEKRALAQRAFELATDMSTPPEIVLKLRDQNFAIAEGRRKDAALKQKDAQIAQKDKEIELATRKVEMLEAKLKAAGEAVADTKLTPAEREARIKEIFGVG